MTNTHRVDIEWTALGNDFALHLDYPNEILADNVVTVLTNHVLRDGVSARAFPMTTEHTPVEDSHKTQRAEAIYWLADAASDGIAVRTRGMSIDNPLTMGAILGGAMKLRDSLAVLGCTKAEIDAELLKLQDTLLTEVFPNEPKEA